MADDEKLITNALETVFKNAKIPPELYEKRQFELKVDDNEVVKVNMTLKRGLVLDIEEDSHFKAFLSINDIVLTVNDKVANKTDFKLHDIFKEKGCKSFLFTYIRMKWMPDDRPAIDDSEKKEGYEYRVFALFHYQRVPIGLILQSFQGAKVMVMEVAAKSIGSMCLLPGDCILALNGVRQTNDAAKTLDAMAIEIEQKGFARITIERPMGEVAKATAAFTIQTENRDLPMPSDCAQYVKVALRALKSAEPKNIMKAGRCGSSEKDKKEEKPSHPHRVGFQEQIHSETQIPSDIPDELLIKTPNRVPGVTVASVLPSSLPPPQPPSAEIEKESKKEKKEKESSQMGVVPTIPPPQKENKKRNPPSKKSNNPPESNKGRKKASAETVNSDSKASKKKVNTNDKGGNSKSKTKRKAKRADNKSTGGDTEGSAR